MVKMKKLAKEPLVHFIAIGVVIYSSFGFLNPKPDPTPEKTIVISVNIQEQLSAQFQSIWKRQPTQNERERLTNEYIREEVFYREAIELGLDQGDTVIRQRLKQKLEFISATLTGTTLPTDKQLKEHLTANHAQFMRPAKMAYSQIVLGKKTSNEEIAAFREQVNSAAPLSELQKFHHSHMLPVGSVHNKCGLSQWDAS
ncbi:hypothetical protein [Parendozoicomonas sp. Alg238-R29]|uniref:hypothetical protein n=1 Tax=Parendozoicomonas sp. Alg238-R29 TaxID=2993446 RepID=UPI00248E2569|nr:hypothetical protein [Parendozoicomonas sp. Alg238-R29]